MIFAETFSRTRKEKKRNTFNIKKILYPPHDKQFLDELAEIALSRMLCHNVHHLLADSADLRRLGVSGLLDLRIAATSLGDAEEANKVSVGGFHINERLNEGVPLADDRAKLISGKIHTMEVGQAVASLDIFNTELDLAERKRFIVVQVSQVHFDHTALKVVRRNFYRRKDNSGEPMIP